MGLELGRHRAVITNVYPEIDGGQYAIKRILGEQISIQADIFADGHTDVAASLLFRHEDKENWEETPMELLGNDRWTAFFVPEMLGNYVYTLNAWVDSFKTWQKDLSKKFEAKADITIEIKTGILMCQEALKSKSDNELEQWVTALQKSKNLEQTVALATNPRLHALMKARYPNKSFVTCYPKNLKVTVERFKARCSAWYELFPRSTSQTPGEHGTLKGCKKLLPEIAQMGFDVLYLPPIHPIGMTKRKGKNNTTESNREDPGSPWAIGGHTGGHTEIHPELGTQADFEELIQEAGKFGLEIALDLAFQCSPDHPYLQSHPQWFKWRPDGTIQHAENPPKKYEDIVPFDFECEDYKSLWEELKNVTLHWLNKGVKIFRVDNPHTKPFPFWEWLIAEVKKIDPEVIFLAEAFTRPKVMYQLAKLGFSQSYTYFTWRHTKKELTDYLLELTKSEIKEYFRPNFWPNTPDILPEELQEGKKPAFIVRFLLAATLSSNYGIYGPAFELMENKPVAGKEEYLNAEKYEIKQWQRSAEHSLASFITRINKIRREHPALQNTNNIHFLKIDNEQLIYFLKHNDEKTDVLLIVISLDTFQTQTAQLRLPLELLELPSDKSYKVQELITEHYFLWEGEHQEIVLNPLENPGYIFHIKQRLKQEADFEYYL